jgi:uracil-DNA glycosylase
MYPPPARRQHWKGRRTAGYTALVATRSRAPHIMGMGRAVAIETAEMYVPRNPSLTGLRKAASGCKACDLYKRGTQTVFGEGGKQAELMLVGEQPGNEEDLAGHPFVGPAGKVLDKALEAADIDRSKTYVTNIVKHFKWVPRGKKRIHEKPNAGEIRACLPWFEWEFKLVQPQIVVCLGATAAQAILGKQFRVTQQRGQLLSSTIAPKVVATVHPSSILRAPDDDTRREEMQRFIADLKKINSYL